MQQQVVNTVLGSGLDKLVTNVVRCLAWIEKET
jgi:hypothetical protein